MSSCNNIDGDKCNEWAAYGTPGPCTEDKDYMKAPYCTHVYFTTVRDSHALKVFCRKACGYCSDVSAPAPASPPATATRRRRITAAAAAANPRRRASPPSSTPVLTHAPAPASAPSCYDKKGPCL